jgi:hypothetical protein
MDLTGSTVKQKLITSISKWSTAKCSSLFQKSDLPPGTKIIDSVWAMKKKSNRALRGRINARGFKQVKGQHYDGTTISSPVTNSAIIGIVLVLMVMADMIAHVVDVKGAFLHGEFEDGKKIHMNWWCYRFAKQSNPLGYYAHKTCCTARTYWNPWD